MRRQSAHDRRRVTSSVSCCEIRSPLCGNHVRGTEHPRPLDRRQDGATNPSMRACALLAIVLTATACDEDTGDDAASGSMTAAEDEGSSDAGESSDGDPPVDEPSAEYNRCNGLIGCIDTSCNDARVEWQTCTEDNSCSIADDLWESYEGCAYDCGTDADMECSQPEPLCISVIGEAWRYASDCVDDDEKACELLAVECVDVW